MQEVFLLSNFRLLSAIFSAIGCFTLAIVGLARRKHDTTNFLFIGSNVSLGLWNISDLLTSLVTPSWATRIDRFSYLFALLVLLTFFLLLMSVSSPGKKIRVPKVLMVGLLFFIVVCPTPLLIKAVKTTPVFDEIPGALYPVFVVYFLSWLAFGLFKMYQAFKSSQGFLRNQLKYFGFALIVALLAAINYFAAIFFERIPPLYYLLVILYASIVAYSVIRYRLMDFDLIIRWGIAYGALIAIAVGIFGVTVLGTEHVLKLRTIPGIPTLIAVMVLVLFFESIKEKTTSFIDRFVFQSPDFKIIIEGIQNAIHSSTTISDFAEKLVRQCKEIWQIEHCGLILWNSKSGSFQTIPSNEFDDQVISKIGVPVTYSDFLIRTLESERRLFQYGIVIEDEVTAFGNQASPGERTTFWKIRRTMRWMGAQICVPIMEETHLIGILVLGQKRLGSLYNREDRKFLAHLSILIGNAVRQLSAQENQYAA